MGQGPPRDQGGVTVRPGETAALRYSFNEPGPLKIGCHQPSHYADGMVAELTVSTRRDDWRYGGITHAVPGRSRTTGVLVVDGDRAAVIRLIGAICA